MQYFQVQDYVGATRLQLQDLVAPYRYDDYQVVAALNSAMCEVSRLRPDMFLDMKYQKNVPCDGSTYGDMVPAPLSADAQTMTVPIPSLYWPAIIWYMSGYLQAYDVEDTQDQRAQVLMGKLASRMMTAAG